MSFINQQTKALSKENPSIVLTTLASSIKRIVQEKRFFKVGALATVFVNPAIGQALPPEINVSDLNGLNGFVLNGVTLEELSGVSVSDAGDFNGDGISDVIIGASTVAP